MIFEFPKNFFWGTATSAHQVSGNNHNDASEWEKRNCLRLADQAKDPKSKWTKWQREQFPEMFTPENYLSGQACDHYHLYESDFDLAKGMANNAHRFSIEWSRVMTGPDTFDQEQIDHYRKVIRAMKDRGLEPFVTLWHYTSPVWIYKEDGSGGWMDSGTADHFAKFVERIVTEFKDEVSYWIILNEADVFAAANFLTDLLRPKEFNPIRYLVMMRNFVKAHKKAFQIIKKIAPTAQVGIAKEYANFRPVSKNPVDFALTKILNQIWNRSFVGKISRELDFVGLNIYNVVDISWKKIQRSKVEKYSDVGLPLLPESVYDVIKDAACFKKPIFITESGVADKFDRHRPWYLQETIRNVARAINDGFDVRGYFHWSLLDNFEWNKGFWPRLGLIEVDYKSLKRIPRPSSGVFAKICRENSIEI